MTRRVVHCKVDEFDVYIGRGSPWGNPFVIGEDGTREMVIAKYREWIRKQPELVKQLPTLRGKILGCYCAPNACHGDVLVELCDAQERYEMFTRALGEEGAAHFNGVLRELIAHGMIGGILNIGSPIVINGVAYGPPAPKTRWITAADMCLSPWPPVKKEKAETKEPTKKKKTSRSRP